MVIHDAFQHGLTVKVLLEHRILFELAVEWFFLFNSILFYFGRTSTPQGNGISHSGVCGVPLGCLTFCTQRTTWSGQANFTAHFTHYGVVVEQIHRIRHNLVNTIIEHMIKQQREWNDYTGLVAVVAGKEHCEHK